MNEKPKKSRGLKYIALFVLALAAVFCLWVGYKWFTRPRISQIYLYGEGHGVPEYIDEEFELWSQYYHEEGMRHLFVEYPYYTAELLNLWMNEKDDTILWQWFGEIAGTQDAVQEKWDFFHRIKAECPETVFHGTDVGHQYQTTGVRYLAYLKEQGLADSEQYARAQEVMEQGKYYYENSDSIYRENMMVENFLTEYAALNGEDIMGIYGSAHVDPEGLDYYTQTVPCMAGQLKETYGEHLHTEFMEDLVGENFPTLSQLELPAEGETQSFNLGGKTYSAVCVGWQDIRELTGGQYLARVFWQLEEGAFADFESARTTGAVLPYENFPVPVEEGQVFAADYIMFTGGTVRYYLRADGTLWEGVETTVGFWPV
ncbi:hypothetical protein [Faecalibacterium gallinarum]|uniref:Uncharacterized protein n=1 Tax=Faecalibacterium gallinarum TaxID=2903556 RepID=A0AA37J025_9FIRM|nr:hypothetical protein [Faecalibacterium gallinarum]GJN65561.1 hypothetical protein JCM17207_21860 [Faecalibacterium gallinarum]